ncbi:uncharacterized [Tachysurus ichikawai]
MWVWGVACPYTGVACPYTGVACPYTGVACPYTGVACPYTGVACPAAQQLLVWYEHQNIMSHQLRDRKWLFKRSDLHRDHFLKDLTLEQHGSCDTDLCIEFHMEAVLSSLSVQEPSPCQIIYFLFTSC